VQVVLFHYGIFQPLWQQPGLIQCGPRLEHGPHSIAVSQPQVAAIHAGLAARGCPQAGVLIHYTDPFCIRAAALQGVAQWRGPKLLVCGDLHHGPAPIETLEAYLKQQFHDAVLLAFNPILWADVQRRLPIPVHCCPPGFFRYPRAQRAAAPIPQLVHVGSLGPHHPQRRALVEALQRRGCVPFQSFTTATPEQAAEVYAAYALVLNVPLNNDLNHRFFEVMAAGAPQVVFAKSELVGPLQGLAHRADLFWVDQLEPLEQLVLDLLAQPSRWTRPVQPPPELPLPQLLRQCLGPVLPIG